MMGCLFVVFCRYQGGCITTSFTPGVLGGICNKKQVRSVMCRVLSVQEGALVYWYLLLYFTVLVSYAVSGLPECLPALPGLPCGTGAWLVSL